MRQPHRMYHWPGCCRWEAEARSKASERLQDVWLLSGHLLPLLARVSRLLERHRASLQIMRAALPGEASPVIGIRIPER
jgi:hypothetical protein